MAAGRIKGITIEIGGDSTKLVNALAKVDNALSKTQTNLRDINKALKLDPSNTALLKDRQQELAKAIEDTKTKLKTEKEAYEQLSHADKTPENVERMRQLKVQIDLDTVALKDLEKQAKESASVIGTQMQVAGQKMQELGDKIKGVGDKFSQVGQTLTMKVTAPIVAGFTAAIKTTADFDAEMSKVQAISGATASDMETLTAKAREMGETTKFSATESGQAFEYMAMAGWKTEDMLGGIEGIMNLAAASGEELGTTSDIVTDALTALGMQANEAGHFADILAAASSNANTNVAMMGESFKYAAAPAGTLGYTAEDVAIALGLMANSGIKADMAGTSLRNMFNRMAKPTKESAEAMERLGLTLYDDEGKMYSFRQIMDQMRDSFKNINVSVEDYDAALDQLDALLADGSLTQKKYEDELEELNLRTFGAEEAEKARAAAMLGGTRAMSGLLAIANATTEDYEKLTKAVDGSSQAFAKLEDGSVVPLNEALASGQEIIEQYNGQAEAMAATMQDNLNGQMTILKSQLQELAISMGNLLMPMIRDIVGKIQELVNWLNSLDDEQKKHIMQVAAIVAAVGPVLLIIGKVIIGIGSLISAVGTIAGAIGALIPILMGPVGIIALIVAAIVALGIIIYKNWDDIKAWAQGVWEATKEMVAQVVAKIVELKNIIVNKFNEIKTNISNKVNEIKTNIVNKFNEIKTSIVNTVTNIKTSIVSKFNEIRSSVVNTVDNMKNAAVNAFTNLKNSISNTVSNIKNAIVNGFSNAVSYIKSLPSQAWSWGADIINNIVNGIRAKIGAVKDAISNVASTIKSYIHFSVPDVGPLADANTYMPDFMKLIAGGIEKGIPQIQNAMTDMTTAMVPDMTGSMAKNTTNNANVNITVYGSQGQDVRELADIIQQRINTQVYNQGAVFA